ncbi:hypothetical protein Scep_008869 [Stephania cephalantha]|uniref:Homeobox protein knotted-1-like 1 n=1 Tax=Stephania cephalantha TaxID=152367 RepID=A0AAP0JTI5_9MAGN
MNWVDDTSAAMTSCSHHEDVSAVDDFDTIMTMKKSSSSSSSEEDEICRVIKTQISAHPLYPNLVSAYIQCRKVGAPPEMATLLEEIITSRPSYSCSSTTTEIGADPELNDFMESYCKVLTRLKEEVSRPFEEATTFLTNMERQLTDLCKGVVVSATNNSDEAAGSSEEELSCGEMEGSENQEFSVPRPSDRELKEMLLRKYSGYISTLRKEFLKKRKKGKLPKDSRSMLLDWWNSHYRWPYPTEEEKMKLAERTGLDQKQINNWFINQRKRHWKPSEDMRFAVMEGVSGLTGPLLYGDNSRSRNDDHDSI